MIVVVTGGANKPLLSINNVCSAFMQPDEYVHFTTVKTITDKQFTKQGAQQQQLDDDDVNNNDNNNTYLVLPQKSVLLNAPLLNLWMCENKTV